MSKPILATFELSEDLWRAFFEAHYRRDRNLKWRALWGGCCVVIGSMGFGGFYHNPYIAGLLLATGFFGVLSRPLLVLRSVRKALRHPFCGQELTVRIDGDEIAVRSGDAGYVQHLSDFAGYRMLEPGLALYHNPHSFFFIPSTALSAGDMKQVLALLEEAKVVEIA